MNITSIHLYDTDIDDFSCLHDRALRKNNATGKGKRIE